MNDGAIDFRKLLKEEKKKARAKQRQEQLQQHQAKASSDDKRIVETAPQDTPTAAATAGQGNPLLLLTKHNNKNKYNGIIDENNVDAIDFDQLMRDEKARALQQRREHEISEQWRIPNVFDRQQHLVCNNPPAIYYIQSFLPRESDQKALMDWLLSLPENSVRSNHSNAGSSSTNNKSLQQQEKEASQRANGLWTIMHYAKRRVALFDGTINMEPTFPNGNSAADQSLPSRHQATTPHIPAPLQRLMDAFVAQGIFPANQPPNHVLVNEYHAGQGILPHTDGPAYMSRTATLSLGSDVLIQFTPRPNYDHPNDNMNNKNPQLWLEKGSLVLFEDSAYLDYCHGIQDRILEETAIPSQCCNYSGTAAGGAAEASDSGRGHESKETILQRGYRISLTFRHKLAPGM